MAELHRIQYGQQVITYSLEYRKRRTMEISVYPDLTVKVVAPLDRTLEEIGQKIHKRASWIMEQKYFFSLYLPKQPEKQYVSGETHSYLGKKYRLKIVNSTDGQVKLTRGEILISTKDRSNTKKNKQILESWYKEKADEKFSQRLDQCLKKAQKHGISSPSVQIRKMSKRWGSCSKRGTLILNSHLIKAPTQCIDYVIMHELCHIKYFNHGSAYYKLFTKMMPDWEKRKKKLETINIE
jgi:hypothetical protein